MEDFTWQELTAALAHSNMVHKPLTFAIAQQVLSLAKGPSSDPFG